MSDKGKKKVLSRREALGMIGAAGAALSAACNGDTPTSPTATIPATTTTTTTTVPPASTNPPPTTAPIAGAAVDIWQCDVEGNYSEYGSERSQTYLRGVQTTDANGRVTFTTVYPGWYQGRATHIHLEVTVNGRSAKVTQIAFPEDVTAAVYRSSVYASRGQNPTTNSRDNVFSDGVSQELVALVGDTASGYSGTFQIGVPL